MISISYSINIKVKYLRQLYFSMSGSGSKAIFSSHQLIRGFAVLSLRGKKVAKVKDAVHDGDTVIIRPDGNMSIRFLGIDTPEISCQFPKIPGDSRADKWLNIKQFNDYLSDPFSDRYQGSDGYKSTLGQDLVDYLNPLLGPNCAGDHYKSGMMARTALRGIIQAEYDERVKQGKLFRFFMAFAHDVIDRYGRLLCYLHRDNTKGERNLNPLSYNERMLKLGMAFPYFIWPNIDPFRPMSYVDAIPPPQDLRSWIDNDKRLSDARKFVQDARRQKIGVFKYGNVLQPFELRFLARREAPSRYVLNLATCDKTLLKPTEYYMIHNPEDRLFIDKQFIPLFRDKGYQA